MTFRKTLALCIALTILCCCAVSGTLAFPNLNSFFNPAPAAETKTVVKVVLNIDQNKNEQVFPGVPYKKAVTITSKSNVPVYAWYTCTVPAALLNTDGKVPMTIQFLNAGWTNAAAVYPGGKKYRLLPETEQVEFTCLYKGLLQPGETTPAGMQSVTLDRHVDRDENGGYLWIDDHGTVTPIAYNSDSIEMQFTHYAVEATGFNSVEAAYEALTSNPAAE